MSDRWRGVASRVLVVLLLVGCTNGADPVVADSSAAQGESGSYVDVPCPYADEIIAAFGDSLACGVLTAPLVHGVEGSGTVAVSVARLLSTSGANSAVPLVMLLGGPGQEVESILPLFAVEGEQSYRPLLDHRDVILMDQRGVGYSEPSLACPFDAVGGVRVPAQRLDPENPVPGFAVCAADLREKGLNLEAFDSVQSAADVGLLRRSMGFEQVDLLGTSYGTRLALTVMRDFPATVRSATLESPEPLDANLVAGQIIGFDRALDRVFAECEAAEACRSRYPDLSGTFAAAVDSLNDTPLDVSVSNPGTGALQTVEVDGTSFISMVYLATFLGPLLPLVPALIDGIRTGDNVVLESIAPYTLGYSAGVSLGASYVINCNDELGFTSAGEVETKVSEAGVRPQLADGRFAGAFATIDICDEFGVSAADPAENQPVLSDVPVLILSGAFDPITPPAYADQALESLPNGTGVTFSNGSHAPLSTSGACGFGIVSDFLDDPGSELDSSCATQTPVDFVILPD